MTVTVGPSSFPLYATSDHLTGWLGTGTPPANADTLIRVASLMVGRAVRLAIYDTDVTGFPTDPDVVNALREATLAQAATWVALGVDPVKGRADDSARTVTQKSIGGATIQYAVYASQAEARAAATVTLCEESLLILSAAGLTGGGVGVWG